MHITLGRDYYSSVNQINNWCTEMFGEGKWFHNKKPIEWTDSFSWTVHQMFGYTTYAFKNEKDYMLFLLKWDHGDHSED